MSVNFAGRAGRWLILAAFGLGLGGLDHLALAQPGKTTTKKPPVASPKPTPKPSPKPALKAVPKGGDAEEDEDEFPYKVLPLFDDWDDKGKDKKTAAEAKAKRSAVEQNLTGLLNGSKLLDEEALRKEIETYFQRYFFARLTHPAGLTEWPDARRYWRQRISPSSVPEPVHAFLVKLGFDTLSVIVKGDYHPAARYNAMWFIANLNAVEPVTLGEQDRRKLATPYINALKFMLDEYGNPNQIDAVRVAALAGILRHVEIDRQTPTRRLVNNNAETRIVDTMVDLLKQQEPPPGRLRGGHDWMRRRAADVLGQLGAVGENGKAVAALDALVGNDKEPVSLRCTAAEALGRLSYTGKVNLKAGDTGKKFAALAAFACEIEIRRVEEQQAREQKAKEAALQAAGVYMPTSQPLDEGTSPFPRPRAASGPDPLAYRIDLTRRRVKDQMLTIKRGLLGPKLDEKEGIVPLAKAGKEPEYLKKVTDGIDGIISVVDSQSKEMTTLLAQLHTSVSHLEKGCGVTVQLPESEAAIAPEEKPAANPLDVLGLEAGPTKPEPGKPVAPGKPATPAAKPATPGKPATPEAKPATPRAEPKEPAPPLASPDPDGPAPPAP